MAGALLGFVPLIARNLVVGVAPWALSTRGVEAFVCGHAAGSSPFGFGIPPALRSILEASDGRLGPAIRLTLATYQGEWGRLLAHEVTKLGAIVSRYEAMDNANWYYFADRSPFLGWSLRYEVVLALGLVGLWMPGKRDDDRVFRYFLLAAVASLMYATVIGRFRLALAADPFAWPALAEAGRRLRDPDSTGATTWASGLPDEVTAVGHRARGLRARWGRPAPSRVAPHHDLAAMPPSGRPRLPSSPNG